VTRPGNQAGQGRPGPDIHGWRCRKTSSLPVAFLPKSFEPQTGPKFYQQAQCVFRPHVFQANPSSTTPSLPNCLSTAPYLLSFTISCFHDFGTSLPYKSFISSRRLQKKRRIPHQHQQDLHGDDASLPNPMSFNKEAMWNEIWRKSSPPKKRTLASWKEEIPEVFQKRRVRSGDLAARLAAP